MHLILILLYLVLFSCSSTTQSPTVKYLQKETIVRHKYSSNHVRIFSEKASVGEHLVILPSLGRGVEDYTEKYKSTLTNRFVQAGYQVVLIQPRGIGKSSGKLSGKSTTMLELVDDIRDTLDQLGIEEIWLVGHAFGNRLARSFTTYYPKYVKGLALLAAGGNYQMTSEAQNCLKNSFNMRLPKDKRLEMISCAFFAKGNDASIWLNGWFPQLAAAQIHATSTIDANKYKMAAGKKFLVVQASEDFIAPPEFAGKVLAKELEDQVTYKEVEHAGHALTSEQPDEVAEIVIEYFKQY
ncbi:alpha/beta fold hydrolase [Halobacteriovorax sp. ZH4_bin.1]|uniref:alpha/beta fold hydrolase n=2 Tax=Halobacteriovorax TaxID=1652133 RepID=UPI003717AC3D